MKEEKKMLKQLDKDYVVPKLTDADFKQIVKESKICEEENEYSLDQLLSQVTPENIHKEVQWGKARGNEIW